MCVYASWLIALCTSFWNGRHSGSFTTTENEVFACICLHTIACAYAYARYVWLLVFSLLFVSIFPLRLRSRFPLSIFFRSSKFYCWLVFYCFSWKFKSQPSLCAKRVQQQVPYAYCCSSIHTHTLSRSSIICGKVKRWAVYNADITHITSKRSNGRPHREKKKTVSCANTKFNFPFIFGSVL